MSIGEAAARLGVATSTLRFYEDEGLIPVPERSSGRRVYDEALIARVAAIRLARTAGFRLDEIKTLFGGLEGRPPSQGWRALAAAKLMDLDELIQQAEGMKRWLEESLRAEGSKIPDRADGGVRPRLPGLAEELSPLNDRSGKKEPDRIGKPIGHRGTR